MQKQENFKKLLIILMALALFGASYYYYVYKQEKPSVTQEAKTETKQPKTTAPKPVPKLNKTVKPEVKAEKSAAKPVNPVVEAIIPISKLENPELKTAEPEPEKVVVEKKIQPTDRANLVKVASSAAGKHDPFSYAESLFNTNYSNNFSGGRANGLPEPPRMPGGDSPEKNPEDFVEIKGFFGNKVIAEINGFTDSLSVGDTMQGVTILSINPKDLTCELKIEGKKVIKKMTPVTQPNKDVEIKYLNN